jgi:hypothetical protein
VRRHAGLGLCSACWQSHPDRPFVRAESLIAELGEHPDWLRDFAADLAAKYCVSRACTMITSLGRLLLDEQPNHPQALLERSRRSGRSMGSLARALETSFTGHGLAMATDQAERLAAGRRQRRIDVGQPHPGTTSDTHVRNNVTAPAPEFGGVFPRGGYQVLIGGARKVSRYVVSTFGTAPHALLQTRNSWQLC